LTFDFIFLQYVRQHRWSKIFRFHGPRLCHIRIAVPMLPYLGQWPEYFLDKPWKNWPEMHTMARNSEIILYLFYR